MFIHGALSLPVDLNSVNVYNDEFFVKKTNLNVQKIIVTKINKGNYK